MVMVNGVASRTRSKKKERSLNPSPIGSGSQNVFPIDGAGTSANDPIIVGLSDSSSDEGTDNSDEGRGRMSQRENSASASTSSSGSDDSGSSSFDDEDEEEEKEKRRCKRRKKEKKRREPTFESHSNKVLSCDEVIVETECSGIRKKNGENKNNSSSTEK
ncbi:hypothetical protein AHAS_Ahas16G0067300 [Arachis hypogaea]